MSDDPFSKTRPATATGHQQMPVDEDEIREVEAESEEGQEEANKKPRAWKAMWRRIRGG